ncbi:hypothetical protein DIPPA_25810 [Diplonema papillatum]|nr:hypothetical protein DIPPA_25810 [Diplonema papillatum]|eukprot:gene17114-26259_t
METDEDLGRAVRRLVERVAGEKCCSTRSVLQSILSACDDELDKLEARRRPHTSAPTGNTSRCNRQPRAFPLPDEDRAQSPSRLWPKKPREKEPAPFLAATPASPKHPASPPPAAAADGAARRIPRVLVVVSPEKPAVEGRYLLLDARHNDHPMWGSGASQRLYSTRAGYWMLTAAVRGPDRDVGLVETVHPHDGVPPHRIRDWQYYNTSGQWVRASASVRAEDASFDEGRGHYPQAAFRHPFRALSYQPAPN